jgi:cyclophilin family peptidyl-prolyl cis-trans isomerase/HEAT repeat protein
MEKKLVARLKDVIPSEATIRDLPTAAPGRPSWFATIAFLSPDGSEDPLARMTTRLQTLSLIAICGLASIAGAQSTPDSALLQRMLDVEDARPTDPSALTPLLDGLRSPDVATRQIATRAFGRLEQRDNLATLQPMLTDPSPLVRADAFNAIAQIAKADGPGDGSATRVWMAVQGLVRGLISSESDPNVRGAIARTLGRLPYPSEQVARAATESIAGLLDGTPTDGALAREPWFGVVHATDDLLRRFPSLRTAPGVLRVAQIPRVPSVAVSGDSSWSRETNVILTAIRGRVLGVAVGSPNAIDDATARDLRARFLADFGDADAQVRRQVIQSIAVAAAIDDSTRARLISAGLGDPSQSVRVDAVRAYARRRGVSCAPLITASRDANGHVALTAIDALVVPCDGKPGVIARLSSLARALPATPTARTGAAVSWHSGAHAIVSLARVAPDSARAMLPRLVTHPIWQVRMYAARVAGELLDEKTLDTLLQDRSDNVRSAAVVALSSLIRPTPTNSAHGPIERSVEIDSMFISELERSDYQLVYESARALDGAQPTARLGEALYATLERLTGEQRENSRDPRMELLARIETVGNASQESRVRPYLGDFDPAIAARASQVLEKWGRDNESAKATPRRLTPLPVSLASLASLRNARVRITMAPTSGGGSFEMKLFVDEAPATINRFVNLARRGYYNGLTFHRESTNFVIQGGSPGANEYVGNERFMRDELGLRSHERGTLGISTRGRDTGDAQIFVNLIDNWRLDHDYTVFGEITKGIDVADAVLEGDTIARVEIIPGR